MNLEKRMKLAAEFCSDHPGTIKYVRATLLPQLEKELMDINDCERQYAECGLPSYLSDTQAALISVIAKCKARLANVSG